MPACLSSLVPTLNNCTHLILTFILRIGINHVMVMMLVLWVRFAWFQWEELEVGSGLVKCVDMRASRQSAVLFLQLMSWPHMRNE